MTQTPQPIQREMHGTSEEGLVVRKEGAQALWGTLGLCLSLLKYWQEEMHKN